MLCGWQQILMQNNFLLKKNKNAFKVNLLPTPFEYQVHTYIYIYIYIYIKLQNISKYLE